MTRTPQWQSRDPRRQGERAPAQNKNETMKTIQDCECPKSYAAAERLIAKEKMNRSEIVVLVAKMRRLGYDKPASKIAGIWGI